jgi:hypothetical protein
MKPMEKVYIISKSYGESLAAISQRRFFTAEKSLLVMNGRPIKAYIGYYVRPMSDREFPHGHLLSYKLNVPGGDYYHRKDFLTEAECFNNSPSRFAKIPAAEEPILEFKEKLDIARKCINNIIDCNNFKEKLDLARKCLTKYDLDPENNETISIFITKLLNESGNEHLPDDLFEI